MKKLKVVSALLLLRLLLDVRIGELKAQLECQVHVYEKKSGEYGFEVEWTDIESIEISGVEIHDWQRYINFHKEMGINYNSLFQKKVESNITEEVVRELIKDSNISL